MSEFQRFHRIAIAEMRPYVPGETLHPMVSISDADRLDGSPKDGDMIARNPNSHGDQWLVAKAYFEENFTPLEEAEMTEQAAQKSPVMGSTISRLRYPKGYQFFDANGAPLGLGTLSYYVAGTATPQDTYSDCAGAAVNTNPVILDDSGRLEVDVYLGSAANYKEVLASPSATVSPWPDDNIPSNSSGRNIGQ